MKCSWMNIDDQMDGEPAVYCDNEATHNHNCGFSIDSPVCAEHTCRCSVRLDEIERRKEACRIPSSWMAL